MVSQPRQPRTVRIRSGRNSRSRKVRITRVLTSCLTLLLALGCCDVRAADGASGAQTKGSQLGSDKFSKAPAPQWVVNIAAPAAKPSSEPNDLRLGDVQRRWSEAGEHAYHHYVMSANNASGVASLGQLTIDFNPAFQSVQLHTLRIVRSGATLDELAAAKPKFLEREPGLEQSEYTGTVTIAIVLEDLRVGDSLDYSYSIIGSNPVFKGAIAGLQLWETTLPVNLRRVSIQVPRGRGFHYRFIGGKGSPNVAPVESHHGDLKEFVFEQREIPPFRPEGGYPPGYQPFTVMQFSEYRDWGEVAGWAAQLFEMPPPSTAAFANLVTRFKTIPDPGRRAAEALDFVQSEIRYTSISFGENSHRPASPDEVLKRRYGDCKDKTMFLISLYRALGLDARPVLVSVGFHSGLNEWLPAPTPFDHAIVQLRLNGAIYWLDPTAHQKAANLVNIGRLHGGSDVLVADPKTQRLSLIEQPPAEVYSVSEHLHLDSFDGPGTLERLVTTNGSMAENLRWEIAQTSPDEFRKNLLNSVQRTYGSAQWAKDLSIEDDRERNQLVVRETLTVTKYPERVDGGWLLRHEPSIGSFFTVPATPHREAPYGLSFPVKAYYRQEVDLPSKVAVDANDATLEVKNAFFVAHQTKHRKGSTVSTEYDLETFSPRVAAADMDQFVAGIRKARNDFHPVLVVPDAPASQEEFARLQRDAARGDGVAQNKLAQAYLTGNGTAADLPQALAWFRKAADKHVLEAEVSLGKLYYQGLGTTQDYGEASRWFRKAAEKNSPEGEYYLGLLYAQGRGVKQDFAQALSWYRKAADQGSALAEYDLGVMYSRGHGVPVDTNTALSWYRKSADQGIPAAEAMVGLVYATGEGVSADPALAYSMSRKAAERGNALAQNTLAWLYERGAGVPRSADSAVDWYRKAADQGYARAQYNLGRLYFFGTGVAKDPQQGVSLWQKAAASGDAAAQHSLGLAYESGEGVQQDLPTALSWLTRAADQRYAPAQNSLGLLYAKGQGVSRDLVLAHMWFNLAAATGNEQAKKNRDYIAGQMSSIQIEDAQKRARAWQPSAPPAMSAALP